MENSKPGILAPSGVSPGTKLQTLLMAPVKSVAKLAIRKKFRGTKHMILAIIRFLRDELDDPHIPDGKELLLNCALESLEYAFKMEMVHDDFARMGPTIDLWKVYLHPTMHKFEIARVAFRNYHKAQILRGHGVNFMGHQQFEAAIDCFNRCIHLNPNFYSFYYLRGSCYHSLQKFESAIEDFQLALLRQPQNPTDCYYFLGSCYYQMNLLEKSTDCFIQAYRYDWECCYLFKVIAYSVHDELVQYNKKCPEYGYVRTDEQFYKCILESDYSYIVDNAFSHITSNTKCNFDIVRRFGVELCQEVARKNRNVSRKLVSPSLKWPLVPASTGDYIFEDPQSSQYINMMMKKQWVHVSISCACETRESDADGQVQCRHC